MMDTSYPLSFSQESLFLLDELTEGTQAYYVPLCLNISGSFSIDVFKKSLECVVVKNAIFRTSFGISNSKIKQHISQKINLEIQEINVGEGENNFNLEAIHFNLNIAPLIRCSVLKYSNEKFQIFLIFHHIIIDIWSVKLFLKELSRFYNSILQNEVLTSKENEVQYYHFALWQRDYFSKYNEGLKYWQNKLYGNCKILDLPFSKARPKIPNFRGKLYKFSFPLSLELKQLTSEDRIPLLVVFLTCFQILLFRYTQQEDISIGIPVANRTQKKFLDVMGPFINTIVIRKEIYPHQSFIQLLKETQETVLDALSYQDVPFAKVVAELGYTELLGHSPLFNVFFNFIDVPLEQLKIKGAEISMNEIEQNISKFDLSLHVKKNVNSFDCILEYNDSLFEVNTIKNIASYFLNLVKAAEANKNLSIINLPVYANEEINELMGI